MALAVPGPTSSRPDRDDVTHLPVETADILETTPRACFSDPEHGDCHDERPDNTNQTPWWSWSQYASVQRCFWPSISVALPDRHGIQTHWTAARMTAINLTTRRKKRHTIREYARSLFTEDESRDIICSSITGKTLSDGGKYPALSSLNIILVSWESHGRGYVKPLRLDGAVDEVSVYKCLRSAFPGTRSWWTRFWPFFGVTNVSERAVSVRGKGHEYFEAELTPPLRVTSEMRTLSENYFKHLEVTEVFEYECKNPELRSEWPLHGCGCDGCSMKALDHLIVGTNSGSELFECYKDPTEARSDRPTSNYFMRNCEPLEMVGNVRHHFGLPTTAYFLETGHCMPESVVDWLTAFALVLVTVFISVPVARNMTEHQIQVLGHIVSIVVAIVGTVQWQERGKLKKEKEA